MLLGIVGVDENEIYAVGASREANREARPVVWVHDGESWQRRHAARVDAFLWDAACTEDGACYAVGTDNTFVALNALRDGR